MAVSRMKALFFGSKQLGLNVFECLLDARADLEWIVVHPDDGADPRSCLDAFRSMAEERGVQFLLADNAAGARQLFTGQKAQIGFVCGWYWLFSASDLDQFPNGLWGIHNSLLPKFRGGAPLVWSIIAGEPEVGSTVFRISPGMDDGEVLLQAKVKLATADNVGSVLSRIEAMLLEQLPEKWCELIDGRARLVSQNEKQATYCGQRSDQDGGIDWTLAARQVHDFIRAQSDPYPGAWTWHGSNRLRVILSELHDATYFGTPGQVLRRLDRSVLVSCGHETALRIVKVRRDGETIDAPAADLLGSVNIRLRPTSV